MRMGGDLGQVAALGSPTGFGCRTAMFLIAILDPIYRKMI